MAAPQVRAQRKVLLPEDADKLEFGPDFQNVKPIMLSEVVVLLEHRKKRVVGEDVEEPFVDKTLEYVKKFSQYKDRQTIRELRQVMYTFSLEPFELVQLCNLAPDSGEEACRLVPSLTRLEDDVIGHIVTELSNFRRFL